MRHLRRRHGERSGFRTVDGGATWGNGTGPFGGRAVNDVAYDPANRDVLYVALSGFGGPHLYKTTNLSAATASWSAIDAGIPDMPINAVLVDPETSAVVYAGSDLGLFKSVDGGATWGINHSLIVFISHRRTAPPVSNAIHFKRLYANTAR